MSFRSYFLLLFSLIYSNFAYPILVTVTKISRNGQTIYLLGDCYSKGNEFAKEEKEQIDLVLRSLNEQAQEKGRKIQILYEKASTTVHRVNTYNWDPVYRFLINIDELLGQLNNPNISLHDIENRVISGEIAFLLRCKGNLQYQDVYFDRGKAPKELKDITLKDLFDELTSQIQALENDVPNIPTEAEKERCREQINYCRRNIGFLNQDIAKLDWPEDKPFIEFAKNLGEEWCDEYITLITEDCSRFMAASVGHRILKSNPNEDIVVITGASNVWSITQYIMGLGWSYDAHCGDIERDLLTLDEINSVMSHKHFSEKVLLQLKTLGAQTQQSLSATYATFSTYLKSLGGSTHDAK